MECQWNSSWSWPAVFRYCKPGACFSPCFPFRVGTWNQPTGLTVPQGGFMNMENRMPGGRHCCWFMRPTKMKWKDWWWTNHIGQSGKSSCGHAWACCDPVFSAGLNPHDSTCWSEVGLKGSCDNEDFWNVWVYLASNMFYQSQLFLGKVSQMPSIFQLFKYSLLSKMNFPQFLGHCVSLWANPLDALAKNSVYQHVVGCLVMRFSLLSFLQLDFCIWQELQFAPAVEAGRIARR